MRHPASEELSTTERDLLAAVARIERRIAELERDGEMDSAQLWSKMQQIEERVKDLEDAMRFEEVAA